MVQVMAYCLFDTKLLPGQMLIYLQLVGPKYYLAKYWLIVNWLDPYNQNAVEFESRCNNAVKELPLAGPT